VYRVQCGSVCKKINFGKRIKGLSEFLDQRGWMDPPQTQRLKHNEKDRLKENGQQKTTNKSYPQWNFVIG
jgi:hypothetical protein